MELPKVDTQMLDRLVGQRHDAGLVPLAGEGDVPGLDEGEVPKVRPVISLTRAAVS